MTLVAPRKKPTHHKKSSGKHHRHSKTYHKPYWPYIPVIGIVLLGLIFSNSIAPSGRNLSSVLSYSSEMSTQSLLDYTNTQRLNNGQSALAMNGQLNNAAQAKANDMVSKDYWSHNTIDGRTPWSFVAAAGYNYQLTGENLAYGFDSSSDTITGWMNSPGHRANILNSGYREVGFGVANAPNFHALVYNSNTGNWEASNPSGGPFTIVVAMYGAQPNTPVAAATPAPAAVQKTTTAAQSAPAGSSGGAAVPTAEPVSESEPVETATQQPAEEVKPPSNPVIAVSSNTSLKNIQEPDEQHVSRSQILTAGKAPWSGLAVALIGSGAIVLFLLRHAIAWRKVIRHGEQLVIHHPVLDIVFTLAAVAAIILSRSAGVIR